MIDHARDAASSRLTPLNSAATPTAGAAPERFVHPDFRRTMNLTVIAFASALAAAPVWAQGSQEPKPEKPDTAVKLHSINITAAPSERERDRVTAVQRVTLPAIAGISARKAEETVNLVDTEDAVKYLPSVFLRKRNYGDTQATMATRTWGVSSSARSLIFADGVPLTALVANNNTLGGPRWGLVSPSEIARIDMMYGPFSAAYAGNSMGAVMEITTRLPEKLEGSISQTQAMQRFDLYGTKSTYGTAQTTGDIGARFGKLSIRASGNYQNSESQPLSYVTGSFPNGTTGGYPATNKLGAPANILGASGLLNTGMTNAKAKVAYDLAPNVRAAYTFGYWKNDASSSVDPFIDKSGQPTFAGNSGFASGFYNLDQRHTSQSLSLRSDTQKMWDFELVGTTYSFGTDQQRTPTSASSTDMSFGQPGRVAVLDGTGWTTFDAKGIWRPGGNVTSAHTLSFGIHHDRYVLENTTFNTPDWRGGDFTTVFTEGDGKTQTQAVWAQDTWRLTPTLRFTFGGRYEWWKGYDGYNASGNTTVDQPEVSASKFSPKGSLAWSPSLFWTVTGSVGKAYRFATASELYQLVSTGTTFASPNPDLKPDNVLASELRVERKADRTMMQVALFRDDIHDAIISQFLPLVPGSSQLYSYLANVDHVRSQGVEVVLGSNNLFVRGLELQGTATYTGAKTLALSGRASANAPAEAAIGKALPNIPKRRATFSATYRPDLLQRLALTVAGRYSDKMYTTLDNTDVNPNTYQGFSSWFVMDTRANFRFDTHWSVGLGVDNVLNRKYFLFHPFPQRTFVGSLKYAL
jgi:iron complex outermembrane receptor protein